MVAALITHGGGPLTPALVARLTARGVTVTVTASDIFGARRGLPRDALVTMAGSAGMSSLLTGFDIVIDNRVLPPGRRRAGAIGSAYVQQTRTLVAAAAKARVGRYVHVRPMAPRHHGWALRRAAEVLGEAHSAELVVARVGVPPLIGPEPGVSTEVNALVLRMLLGRLPAVGLGSTSLLSASDAAEGVVAVALDPVARSRVLPGAAYTYRQIAAVTADLLGRPRPAALPRRAARVAVALSDLVARDGLPVRGLRFETTRCDGPDRGPWPALLVREDVRAVVEHFRGRPVSR